MFWNKKKENILIATSIELLSVKAELATLKLDRQLEEKEIKHLIRMREEQLHLEKEKAISDIRKEHTLKLSIISEEHNNETKERLEQVIKDTKEMYGQILGRLPNIEVAMKKDI